MLFATGTRVRMKHTGDEGVITGALDMSMVNVLLDNEDMEIPVFVEDLINIEEEKQAQSKKTVVKAKVVKGKQKKVIKKPEFPEMEMQYAIIKSMGLQLAFDPVYKADNSVEKYQIYLINDTQYAVLFSLTLALKQVVKIKLNDKLDSVSAMMIGELYFDQLNDIPHFKIECWQITTAGTGKKMSRDIKIKAQQFFKKTITAPIINKKVHHYKVFENFDVPNKKGEDLKSYTKRNTSPSKANNKYLRHIPSHEVADFANFETEIDLHLEKLQGQKTKVSNAEKLRLQLYHFDEYLDKAIRLGVPRVFIIHGVGKGRLKNEIASRLVQHPDVKTFKNEYHPRYGYGATEVIF